MSGNSRGVELGSERWRFVIARAAAEFGLDIGDTETRLFDRHARELLFWNRKTNLTAITDPSEIAIKHYVDSILPLLVVPEKKKLLDIGSGGGFPGIPLKICRPELSVTLVDASRKKTSFLNHICRLLELDGTKAFHGRAERFERMAGFEKSFDLVIGRALIEPERFVEMALPFLKPDGAVVSMQGKIDPGEEKVFLRKMSKKNLSVTVHRFTLPLFGAHRSLLKIVGGQ